MKALVFTVIIFLIVSSHILGNSKNNPKTAHLGTNTCEHNEGEDCWFIFKPQSYVHLNISSCQKTDTDTYCEVYYKNTKEPIIRSDDYCRAQSKVKILVVPDSTYLIRWRGIYANSTYEWDFYEETIREGEHYSSAVDINEGDFETTIPAGQEFWYRYLSQDYTLLQTNSSYNGYEIYEGKVDDSHKIHGRYMNHRINGLISTIPGEIYYFKWANNSAKDSTLKWTLDKPQATYGQSFNNARPFLVDETKRSVSTELSMDTWYSYSADSAGIMSIFPEYYRNITITVVDKQSEEIIPVKEEHPSYEPRRYEFRYEKGHTYLFRFRCGLDYSYSSSHSNFQIGENMYVPIEVGNGTHYAKTEHPYGQWFRYTSNANQKLSLSTEYGAFATTTIHLIDEESGKTLAADTCNNHTYGDSEWNEARINTNVSKDKSYLIYVGKSQYSSIQGFMWDLRESANDCNTPVPISDNEIGKGFGNIAFWYGYTTTKRCKLSANAIDLKEDEKLDISFYLNCDSFMVTNDSVLLESGTKVLVKAKGIGMNGAFQFKLHEEYIREGSLDYPINIEEGIHELHKDRDVWYKYIPHSEGKIELEILNDVSTIPDIEFYRNIKGHMYRITFNHIFKKAAIRGIVNEAIFIKWPGSHYEDVTFSLKKLEYEQGDIIQKALKANEGLNYLDKLNRMPMWYYYVPKSHGYIEIKTCDLTDEDTYVSVWDSIGATSSSIFDRGDQCGKQSYVKFKGIPNDTVYLVWYEDYIESPYNWSITEEPFKQGDHRLDPIDAVEGENHSSFKTHFDQWYKYVAKSNGRLSISNCDYEAAFNPRLKVYKNEGWDNVSGYSMPCGWNKANNSFFCEQGATYYVKFESGSIGDDRETDWKLKEIPFEEGEVCDIPLEAVQGSNISDSDKRKWYSYTAKNNSEITISRCGINDNYPYYVELKLHVNCQQRTYHTDLEHCDVGKKYTFQALKDSTYWITWSGLGGGDLQWTLDETPHPQHGYCEDAQEAKEGINTITENYQQNLWYSFQVPTDGKLIISSMDETEEDTKLEIFSDCSDGIISNRIWSVDDYYGKQSYYSLECKKGATYYFCWHGDKINNPYSWSLTFKKQGDYPELPLEAVLGENKKTNNGKESQFFIFKAKEEKYLYEIFSTNNESKTQKFNIPLEFNGSKRIDYLPDSTHLEIRNSYNSDYIIECKGDINSSYSWFIQEKEIDTIQISQNITGHSNFMNDWFAIDTTLNGYYHLETSGTIENSNNFEVFTSAWSTFHEANPSFTDYPIYLLSNEDNTLLKWKNSDVNNYNWSMIPFKIADNDECFDASLAQLGSNHIIFDGNSYIYKLRAAKSGDYTLSANISDVEKNELEDIQFSIGQCDNKNTKRWYDIDNQINEENNNLTILLDSISNKKSYYIDFRFRNYNKEIRQFDWKLKLEAEYDVGIGQQKQNHLSIDKNPNNGHFSVLFEPLKTKGQLLIYHITGKAIHSETVNPDVDEVKVNISNETGGLYLVVLKTKDEEYHKKVLIISE